MIHHGDCVEVMATLPAESVDAVVTDPPYGLEFMGKEWDRLWHSDDTKNQPDFDNGGGFEAFTSSGRRPRFGKDSRLMQEWHHRWALEAFRVAKPGAYLLAFGGTRTFHRLAVAIEDAGWIIRDTLVWGYASGFPKGRANLKPAWEPIVMARKPGPLRPLAIDECRIPTDDTWTAGTYGGAFGNGKPVTYPEGSPLGRWPANIVLTDPIFDGGVDGVVGGGEASFNKAVYWQSDGEGADGTRAYGRGVGKREAGELREAYGDSGTYSRFFLVPKAARQDREPTVKGGGAEAGARLNAHPT